MQLYSESQTGKNIDPLNNGWICRKVWFFSHACKIKRHNLFRHKSWFLYSRRIKAFCYCTVCYWCIRMQGVNLWRRGGETSVGAILTPDREQCYCQNNYTYATSKGTAHKKYHLLIMTEVQIKWLYNNGNAWTVPRATVSWVWTRLDQNLSLFFQSFFLDFESTISCDCCFNSSRVMMSASSFSRSSSGWEKQFQSKTNVDLN